MIISEALITITKQLHRRKINTASLDAEVVLSLVLKKPKEFLYTHPEKNLTKNQIKKLIECTSRRMAGEPIAYITKNQAFYGRDFFVDRRVLIPRPETELIIDTMIRYARGKKITIADIGTGSGCIAVTLKKELPKATVYATDQSTAALAVARKNAKTHRTNISFFKGDLLIPLRNKKIDVVVANLPYLTAKQLLPFEPRAALYGGKNGLALYEQLLYHIQSRYVTPNRILLEIDPAQTIRIKKIITKILPLSTIEIKKDLANRSRLVIITIH